MLFMQSRSRTFGDDSGAKERSRLLSLLLLVIIVVGPSGVQFRE